jgi:Pyruvate/2-oxoglutarate dehydrogenase complex, dihydrolipoamide dehydrogenase (E3) component, and related enzymes
VPDFDVVVIGGGVAGFAAAVRSAELGKSVAIVEKDLIGGECLNRACIPSKTLVDAAKLVFRASKSTFMTGSFSVNYSAIQNQKDKVISSLRAGLAQTLEKHGVKVIRGTASVSREGKRASTVKL